MHTLARVAARPVALAVTALCFGSPAKAVSLLATSSTFKSVFAAAAAGDTIILKGSFGRIDLANRSFATPLRIDASQASFSYTLSLRNIHGLSMTGGRFGPGSWQNGGTIRVQDSSNIGFINPVLTADGLGAARGLTFTNTDGFSVTGGSFSGFRLAIGSISSSDGTLTNNRITRATSDGINIVGSHRVTASGNSCAGGIPSPGAHADCIQLWSISGKPPQSDIKLLYNTATGNTQGFTSFNPASGGGLRISMIGNRVDTSMPQGIACYGCVDSIITDNVLTTLPGARYRTSLNVFGGSNNIVANNSIGPRVAVTPPPIDPPRDIVPPDRRTGSLTVPVASGFGDLQRSSPFAAVPEPATWLSLITGFALVGCLARRRRSGELRLQEIG